MDRRLSPQRRREIIDALRRGVVPKSGLDALAVGLEAYDAPLERELALVKSGGAVFKAVRGEYGCGKTFFARRLTESAKAMGFAASEIQISETETPLHRLETVYRRLVEQLSTADTPENALLSILDNWFFTLEEDVLAEGHVDPADEQTLLNETEALMERRLADVSRAAPMFGAALRGYRRARVAGDAAMAEGIAAWLGGQPNVSAAAKRCAGVRGDIDHFGAMGFLRGLLAILRDCGDAGLIVVLDEVETVQRMRSDVRDKSLNALRQWIDETDSGKYPGLYLLVTGTPAFFDGPQGVKRLEPLAQRLHVDFQTDARFDNPRAVQIRLAPFDLARLREAGRKVRDIFAADAAAPDRIMVLADDGYIEALAAAVAGRLGGKAGIAPRVFLKKLVADVLDRIDQFPDFDPRTHYALTLADAELTPVEREAAAAATVNDIELTL